LKRLLIELPTWLGDAVMATPAIKALIKHFKDYEITIVGSRVSVELFSEFKEIKKRYIDNTKRSRFRLFSIYRFAKNIGRHDIAITFRNSLPSALLLYFTRSKIRVGLKNGLRNIFLNKSLKYQKEGHQVERYICMVEEFLNKKIKDDELSLNFPVFKFERPTIGINPGAAYGTAKRWYSDRFAEVAKALSKDFDIIIFGGPKEIMVALEIEKILRDSGIENFNNIAGRTTIGQLCSKIAGLALFITGDSGPMHIAAAYKVPTISIFGPTDPTDTSQWKNPNNIIIKAEVECAPCLKRVCPKDSHECMKSISVESVIEKARKSISDSNENKE